MSGTEARMNIEDPDSPDHERAKSIWFWGLPNPKEGNESDSESKDEISAEMQEEDEAEDSIGKDKQNPQLVKLLGKLFRSRMRIKSWKTNLNARTGRKTAKPLNQREWIPVFSESSVSLRRKGNPKKMDLKDPS